MISNNDKAFKEAAKVIVLALHGDSMFQRPPGEKDYSRGSWTLS